MIVKVHRIGPVVGRVVWPLVMKVFVTGITQNCCKWFSRTDGSNLPRNKKYPMWLWHFSMLVLEFYSHWIEIQELAECCVLCRKLLVSNISFMRKRNLGRDNNRLCQHDISRVGKQNIKLSVKCFIIVVPTFLVHFANNEGKETMAGQGEAFKLQPVLTRPSLSAPLPASCSNDLSLLAKLEPSPG